MPTNAAFNLLPPSRRQLLSAIKLHGPIVIDDLAAETFLSPGAVRQHVMALSLQGLVRYEELRGGPGRPRHVFSLTSQGESLFPQVYAEVADALLAALEAEPAATQGRVIGRFCDIEFDRHLADVHGSDPASVLAAIQARFEEAGFLPVLSREPGGEATLSFQHCPLYKIARRHPSLCRAEEAALQRALPGATVKRLEHRMAGDRGCSYRVGV
jgi:predicted ArsR family transcriptional regulator